MVGMCAELLGPLLGDHHARAIHRQVVIERMNGGQARVQVMRAEAREGHKTHDRLLVSGDLADDVAAVGGQIMDAQVAARGGAGQRQQARLRRQRHRAHALRRVE